MPRLIKILSTSIGEVHAELKDNVNPRTCEAIWRALPLEGVARRWGDEVYFSVGLDIGLENSSQDVEVGDVAFWPPGRAICIFFGPTPVSIGEKPRAYSPVNVFARILGDPRIFRKVRDGERIRVEKA
ncbi:MAG: cyclophilin-like fold protein [Candidatus Bathyarchaeia archaeon]